jgi:hypothetical protein
MPSTIKIRVIQGKDLPVMDSKSKLTDAFVTVRIHSTTAIAAVVQNSTSLHMYPCIHPIPFHFDFCSLTIRSRLLLLLLLFH